jgi:hypothetical protein
MLGKLATELKSIDASAVEVQAGLGAFVSANQRLVDVGTAMRPNTIDITVDDVLPPHYP